MQQVWDYETGQYERSLKGHTNAGSPSTSVGLRILISRAALCLIVQSKTLLSTKQEICWVRE